MSEQAAWLAHFTARGVAQMDAERARIAAKVNGQEVRRPLPGFFGRATRVVEDDGSKALVAAGVVVLDRAREVVHGDQAASVRRVVGAGDAAGWRTLARRSLAADPRKGLIEAVTVRCSRHDERLWAAWHNGRFVCAWYWSSDAPLERLGWRTTVRARGVLDAIEGRRLTT